MSDFRSVRGHSGAATASVRQQAVIGTSPLHSFLGQTLSQGAGRYSQKPNTLRIRPQKVPAFHGTFVDRSN
jgi:hypothetical protein